MPKPKRPAADPKPKDLTPLVPPYTKEVPREEFGHDDRPAVDTTLPGSQGPKTGPQHGKEVKGEGKHESPK